MRVVLKPLALILLLLTVIGLAGFAFYWQMVAATNRGPGGNLIPAIRLGGKPELPTITPLGKERWINATLPRFEELHPNAASVNLEPRGAREAMQDILNGKSKPVLWISDNSLWVLRLSEAWNEAHPGKPLFDPNSTDDYRTYLRTPLVFVTTQKKAAFLRSHLEGSNSWLHLSDLCKGKPAAPWGKVRYAHADPSMTDSGFLVVGMILMDYADAHHGGNVAEAVNSPGFTELLNSLKSGFIAPDKSHHDNTALLRGLFETPAPYDLVCVYESEAIKTLEKNPDLVILYPNPTVAADVSAVLLTNAEWVTPAQREAGLKLMEVLGDKDSIKAALYDRMRPLRETSSLSIRNVIGPVAAQGVRPSVPRTQAPAYGVANDALAKWRQVMSPETPGEAGPTTGPATGPTQAAPAN